MKSPFASTVLAAMAFAANSALAATTLVAANCQSTIYADGTASPGFTGWTYSGGTLKSRTSTTDIPGDTNHTTNQVLQIENIGSANYALTHTWSANDVFTVTVNASPQAWNLAEQRYIQRYIRPCIDQTVGDVLLWDPGGVAQTALPTANP